MPIYKGESEIGMGAPVQEVYAGATKVWPAGGGMLRNYGIQGANGAPLRLDYRSNDQITHQSNSSYFRCTYPFTWTPGSTMYPLWGNVCTQGPASEIGAAVGLPLRNYTRETFEGITYAVNSSYSTYETAAALSQRVVVPLELDDGIKDSFAGFSSAGALLWGSEDGWSCVRNTTGEFTVTAPREIVAGMVCVTIIQTSTSDPYKINVTDLDVAAGTFKVNTYNRFNGRTSQAFYVMAGLV